MPGCGGGTPTDKYRCLKDLETGFKKLKQKEGKGRYKSTNNDCNEVARKVIGDLRELTDSGLDELLTFEITEKGHKNELKRFKEEAIKNESELMRLEEKLQQQEAKITQIQSESDDAQRILKKENNSLISERKSIETNLGISEDRRRNLEDENKTHIDRMKCLESELQDVKGAKETLENEIERLKKELQQQREEMTRIQSESDNAMRILEKENNSLINERKRIETELGNNKDKRRDLEDQNKRLKKESDQLQKQLDDAEQVQRDLTKVLDNKEREANRLETQREMLQHECNQAKSSIQMHRNTIDKLQKNLTEEKKAKEHALNRLSAAAAHRLRDQNPGITDLSDPNRPLKLAEKVSELYDNEWTNAMENLESLNNIAEEKGIRILLKIIKNVFDTCVDFGDTHLESFPDLLALPPVIYHLQKKRVLSVKDMSSEMLKPMKDFRKSNAEHAISRLQKYIAAEKESKLHIKDKVYNSCKEYIEKCVELCWMMRIQDPPIYMEADYKTNSAFDSNKMRSYTKAGKLVNFVVWPTFFLHKDGPLLAKGVVQGSKSKIDEEELSSSSADDTDDDENTVIAPTDSSIDNKRTDDVPDGKQSHPENDEQSNNDGRNAPFNVKCSETDGREENVTAPQEKDFNPEKDELPNDGSNAPNGQNYTADDSNRESSAVTGDTHSDQGNGMLHNTQIESSRYDVDGEDNDNGEETGRSEKVADT